MEARPSRGGCTQRGLPRVETLRPDHLAMMERWRPPKPRRI